MFTINDNKRHQQTSCQELTALTNVNSNNDIGIQRNILTFALNPVSSLDRNNEALKYPYMATTSQMVSIFGHLQMDTPVFAVNRLTNSSS